MAGSAASRAPRVTCDFDGDSDRSRHLVERALAALHERATRRTRVALVGLLLAAVVLALWQREPIPGGAATSLLLLAVLVRGRNARQRLALVLMLHVAAALVSWELRFADSSRFMFFIATALTAFYNEPRLVWLGALLGSAAHLPLAVVATPSFLGAAATVLFLLAGLLFTGVAADWASAVRRRVIRNARHRCALEARRADAELQLSRAHATERRLVDMAASLRQAQDVLERDVAARKQMATDLEEASRRADAANRAKSTFLASMSHALRTPLNSVIGFSTLLTRSLSTTASPRDLEHLHRIRTSGANLLGLVDDILDLAMIEAGRVEVDMQQCELAPLLRDVIAGLEPRVRPQVRLGIEVPVGVHTVAADPVHLRQVIIHLVRNALAFTREGSVRVVLRLSSLGVPERLDVIDTGPGIAPDRQRTIFEPFEPAAPSARVQGGNGLGLAISRQLCERMGMRLSVKSAEGLGSTFSIALRREPSSILEPAPSVPHRASVRASLTHLEPVGSATSDPAA
ncbi:MAG: hypothetical protein IT361_12400 [Gemmatimonadaceae bacterium]|nr:hypothetical protein [Gemmatimonadaceae bacterium]